MWPTCNEADAIVLHHVHGLGIAHVWAAVPGLVLEYEASVDDELAYLRGK